jgi:hypothetical protein
MKTFLKLDMNVAVGEKLYGTGSEMILLLFLLLGPAGKDFFAYN